LSFHIFNTTFQKSLQKGRKNGPNMESKWNQDLKKESPELILDAMKASAEKMLPKSHGEVSETA
jgi:hypothetical protein